MPQALEHGGECVLGRSPRSKSFIFTLAVGEKRTRGTGRLAWNAYKLTQNQLATRNNADNSGTTHKKTHGVNAKRHALETTPEANATTEQHGIAITKRGEELVL